MLETRHLLYVRILVWLVVEVVDSWHLVRLSTVLVVNNQGSLGTASGDSVQIVHMVSFVVLTSRLGRQGSLGHRHRLVADTVTHVWGHLVLVERWVRRQGNVGWK